MKLAGHMVRMKDDRLPVRYPVKQRNKEVAENEEDHN